MFLFTTLIIFLVCLVTTVLQGFFCLSVHEMKNGFTKPRVSNPSRLGFDPAVKQYVTDYLIGL